VKRDLGLVVVALAAGALFFGSLGRLWPLAPMDLVAPADTLEHEAREFLGERGFDMTSFSAAEWLRVDTEALDYVEQAFGRPQADDWIRAGLPIYEYRIAFKRADDPLTLRVSLHPERGVSGWVALRPRDATGARRDAAAAREVARVECERALGLRLADWEETTPSVERSS